METNVKQMKTTHDQPENRVILTKQTERKLFNCSRLYVIYRHENDPFVSVKKFS